MTLEQQSSLEVKQKPELTLFQKITFFFIGISSAFTVYALIRFSNGLLFESKPHAIQHGSAHLTEDLLQLSPVRSNRRDVIFQFLVRANNCIFGFALTGLITVSLIIIALWLIRFMDTLFGVYKRKNVNPEALVMGNNQIDIK